MKVFWKHPANIAFLYWMRSPIGHNYRYFSITYLMTNIITSMIYHNCDTLVYNYKGLRGLLSSPAPTQELKVSVLIVWCSLLFTFWVKSCDLRTNGQTAPNVPYRCSDDYSHRWSLRVFLFCWTQLTQI